MADEFAVNPSEYGALGFEEWRQAQGFDGSYWGSESLFNRLDNFLSGKIDQQRSQYNAYLTNKEREYEQANLTSARKFQEYLDSTKYQRAVADLKAAGLNPYLAVQSGLSGGSVSNTPVNSSRAESYSRAEKTKSTASSMVSSALKLMAILALKA